jgi:ribose transport system permease protein
MTDTTLPAPRKSGFRFERYASGFLLLASVILYVVLVVASGQTKYL